MMRHAYAAGFRIFIYSLFANGTVHDRCHWLKEGVRCHVRFDKSKEFDGERELSTVWAVCLKFTSPDLCIQKSHIQSLVSGLQIIDPRDSRGTYWSEMSIIHLSMFSLIDLISSLSGRLIGYTRYYFICNCVRLAKDVAKYICLTAPGVAIIRLHRLIAVLCLFVRETREWPLCIIHQIHWL